MSSRALACVLLAACESGSPGQPIVVENVGHVCLHGDPLGTGTQTFAANVRVNLVYNSFDELCVSSSCTTDRAGTCSASLENADIEIVSTMSWVDTSAQHDHACTQDCATVTASCATEPLPAGTYELRFGAGRLSLIIPSQHPEPICFDDR